MAFKAPPDVGPAPDMISDDLPTNLDYLDESFGAAAGLRELRDDDLDEFDAEDEIDNQRNTDTRSGIISRVGGETIRMLHHAGFQTVANHFDILPAISGETISQCVLFWCVCEAN